MYFIRRRLGLIIGLVALLFSRSICLLLFYFGSLLKKRILYISDSRGLVGHFCLTESFWKPTNYGQQDYVVLPIINRQKHTTISDGLNFVAD